ncbi:hypothetical protein R6Q57_008705 [Mikania cordata]
MTSASELFYSRRYRSGQRHNTVDVTGFDSSPADVTSSLSSYQHRSTIRRYSSQHDRRVLDDCVPASRRIHRRRLDHLEHQPEEGGSHSPSGSSINSDAFRSLRRHNRPASTSNDRLPGSVLLARERLVERLRGVYVSGYRQRSGSSSITHQNGFSTRNLLENRSNDNRNSMAEIISESWLKKHQLRLNQDELKCLQLEVFSCESFRKNSMECTICLEGFKDGDSIVCLVCTHRFHSSCLFPWVRVCAACPNCRKPIHVNVPVKQ